MAQDTDAFAERDFGSILGTNEIASMYGASILICLPDGMSHPGSAGTGTVMRPDTLRRYAQEAGFADIEILPIEHDFFRAYRLTE